MSGITTNIKNDDITKTEKKLFRCSNTKCEFEIIYDYHGKNPPFCKNIRFNNFLLMYNMCN